MGLKLVVDSLEGLDPTLAPLYAKDEATGKFRLGVEGVPDVTNLTKALKSERDAREAAEKLNKQFEGLDPAEMRTMLKQMEGNEEAQLIKAGKIDDVIAKRTEKAMKDADKRVKEASTSAEQALARAQKWMTKALDSEITKAATKVGIHSYAVDDALLYARSMFSLDDQGNAVQLGEDGKPVLGKDGKTPFTPLEWLESMRESKPHWFPASASGGGARQSSGNGAGKSMKRSVFDALPSTQKAKLMKEGTTLYD